MSDDGVGTVEMALVMGSSAAAVPDAAVAVKPPVEVVGKAPGSASSMAAVEPVPSPLCVSPPRAHVAITISAPAVSATPVGRSVEDAAWLWRLASPSLGGEVTDAEGHVPDVVETRSSTALLAPAIPPAVVPDAAVDDGPSSTSPAVVDPACASPASVLPTLTADQPRATGPTVSIVTSVVSTLDQVAIKLARELATASSPAPPAPTVPSRAVDPTPSVDVPPAAPAPSVELSRPVPRLSAAWSARLDDGMAEAVADEVMSVLPQLPVDARASLSGDVEGAAGAWSRVVRVSSAGPALSDMVWSWAGAESRESAVLAA